VRCPYCEKETFIKKPRVLMGNMKRIEANAQRYHNAEFDQYTAHVKKCRSKFKRFGGL
jgi:hypothetical protein